MELSELSRLAIRTRVRVTKHTGAAQIIAVGRVTNVHRTVVQVEIEEITEKGPQSPEQWSIGEIVVASAQHLEKE